MRDVDLLDTAIEASGLSASAFAREKLVRSPRQVRRWRAGQRLPHQVRVFLLSLLSPESLAELEARDDGAPETPREPALPRDLPRDPGALAERLLALGWLPPGDAE